MSATNIKSSQGFHHSGKCCHEKNNMQPYPCSPALPASTAARTRTHSGGIGCRADRKRTTEVLNKWGKVTPPSIFGLGENREDSDPVSILSVRFLLMVKVSSTQDQQLQVHTFRVEVMKSIFYLSICTSCFYYIYLTAAITGCFTDFDFVMLR